jgi:putative tricarboxylic transport membrane protein
MLDASLVALSHLSTWQGMLIVLAGTLLCMVVSFVPGVGGASVTSLLLVLTVSWPTEHALMLFGALIGGATFMGSITAILFNIPGSTPSASALLDGFPLGQQGYVQRAIACAATASAIGSTIGVMVLLLLLPILRPLLLEFGPLERALLAIWGLTTILALPGRGGLKAGLMTLLGLVVGWIGIAPSTGEIRWTLGMSSLETGVNLLAAFVGFFALSELLMLSDQRLGKTEATYQGAKDDSIKRGILDVFQHKWLTLRASMIGTLIGAIPGAGGTVAGFVSYGHAVQSARNRELFGKGDIRGLIAPEAATDAKDGGSLIPAIAFGLPGNEAGVLLIMMFAIHGLNPGESMLTSQLPLTMTLIFALLVSNLVTSAVGIALTPRLARVKSIQMQRLALPLAILSCLAVIALEGALTDLYIAIGFAFFGLLCSRFQLPKIPFVIALVLAEFLERNLSLSAQLIALDRINPAARPATITLGILILISVLYMLMTRRRNQPKTPSTSSILGVTVILIGLLAMTGHALAHDQLGWDLPSAVLIVAVGLSGLMVLMKRAAIHPGEVVLRIAQAKAWAQGCRDYPLIPALLSLAVSTPIFGVPGAIGVLVAINGWLNRGRISNARGVVKWVVIAAGTALVSDLLLNQVLQLDLPESLLQRGILGFSGN